VESKRLSIPKISCGHCVMTIKRELGEIMGVSKVEGDPQKKEIIVEWNAPADIEKIKATLKEINFPAAD
jgi:copper chaperone